MIDQLVALVGADAVRTGGAAAPWSVFGAAPRAVVAPATAEQAAGVLERASGEGWAVEPAGAGSWLNAGRPPGRVDLVLSTERLRDVGAYEPADLTATVGAGLPLAALRVRLAKHGQWLPLDPPGHPGGTLGATASTASAGPLRLGQGTPRDHVLGLQLVTGDGRILELGGRVVKNVAGYDLTKLIIGSRGTLGLITRVNVRLKAVPERDLTVAVGSPDRLPLLDAIAAIREARLEPAALELVSPPLAERLLHERAWALLLRLQGNADAVEDARARVESLATGLSAASPRRTLDSTEAGKVWRTLAEVESRAPLCVRLADRPSALEDTLALATGLGLATAAGWVAAAGTGAPDGSITTGALGASTAPDALGERSLAAPLAGEFELAAHAGDGIVRLFIHDRALAAAPAEGWTEALATARATLASHRGTLTVAQSPREIADRFDPFGDPGGALRLMRGLKSEFDPAGVLAPGRFVV